MKFTIDWLKEHLDTKLNEEKITSKLTDVGLEVESFESQSSGLDEFIVAKILNAEQHPNADRLKVCAVDIGKKDPVKVARLFHASGQLGSTKIICEKIS